MTDEASRACDINKLSQNSCDQARSSFGTLDQDATIQLATMDDFLAVIGAHAMRYAIRSGIALTSRYAIGQCSRLLETVDDQSLYTQLTRLQNQLDCKIKV